MRFFHVENQSSSFVAGEDQGTVQRSGEREEGRERERRGERDEKRERRRGEEGVRGRRGEGNQQKQGVISLGSSPAG